MPEVQTLIRSRDRILEHGFKSPLQRANTLGANVSVNADNFPARSKSEIRAAYRYYGSQFSQFQSGPQAADKL